MRTWKHFTPEFKREAVQLLESGSRPASAIARELEVKKLGSGVSIDLLRSGVRAACSMDSTRPPNEATRYLLRYAVYLFRS